MRGHVIGNPDIVHTSADAEHCACQTARGPLIDRTMDSIVTRYGGALDALGNPDADDGAEQHGEGEPS